jgi:hypothetical protein
MKDALGPLFRHLAHSAHSIASTVIIGMIMYFAHRMLQLQYYRYCRSDLIRIIFFNQSPICMHVTNILSIVETAGNHVVKHVMDSVLQRGFSLSVGDYTSNAASSFLGAQQQQQHSYGGGGAALNTPLSIGMRTIADMVCRALFPSRYFGQADQAVTSAQTAH